MKKTLLILACFSLFSCIPYKIAPRIDNYKITNASKFKRDLPNEFAFVFEDDKDADEFYHFVNTKFQLDFEDVEFNVPLHLGEAIYYMSFYEREKTTEVANLVPLLIDGILYNQDQVPILDDVYSSRRSHWYILITVVDEDFNDCLNPNYPNRSKVIEVLQELKKEYQNTHHYIESLLQIETD